MRRVESDSGLNYQQERMFEFAERVGWTLQKRDEELISEFCRKIGVEKDVFKVWLHNNNKNSTLNKRDQPTADILPESVIHKILCYLSFEEASRMRILSKTWLRAWSTHPNLKFRDCSSDKDINVVDKIMERYRDGKIPIEKFEFKISRPVSQEGEVSRQIDKWLGIALQNGVKDLVYTDLMYSSYPFPIFKFLAANSLRELVLTDCDLMHLSLSASHVATYHSLRKLSLSRVNLGDNMLQTLLTSCPLIVDLIVDRCNKLEKIELRNLQRIRSFTININIEQHVKIQAPSLEHLSYCSYSLEELEIVEYENLKSLEVLCTRISDGLIEHLISRPHFLESLVLVTLASGKFNICRSLSLRVLKIKNYQNIGLIDAPNLVSLEYEGYLIPHLKFAKESSKLKNFVLDSRRYKLNAVWFCGLRKFLSNSTSWRQVSLVFSKCDEINMKHLQLYHRVATPQVDVLDVNIKSTGAFPTFVDALLWSCHPRRLNISSSVKMITCFIYRLMYMKNSSHSTSHGNKSWLSQLKEVKAYKFDWENQSWHPVELKSGELATTNLQEREKFYFLLDW